jgi:hypothetical protein
MNFGRRLSVVSLNLLLTASSSGGANVEVFGIVTQARNATLGNSSVSAGVSLYDGDTLTTDVDGALTLRAAASMVRLGRQSRVTLRSAVCGGKCTQLDLSAGTVAFAAPQAAAIEIRADQANIRPAREAATLGQITIINGTSFEIYARRGALKILYRDDSEVIAEGGSYRVALDSSKDEDTSTKSTRGERGKAVKAASHKVKHIALTAIGGSAAAAAGAVPLAMSKDYESPDHPQ